MVFSWAANYEQVTVDYVMLVKSLGGELFDAQGNPVFNQAPASKRCR
jgi:multiple sugar transport system substrate-binding protein